MSLRAAYDLCRRITARHGRTYYLATLLLPARARPATHALYGFARCVDDAVDNPRPGSDPAAALAEYSRLLDDVFAGRRPADPVLAAFADTVRRHDLPRELFDAFLHSMRMDLHVRDYPTYARLREYMYGSACVIGLQMLPVLGTVAPREEATPYAAALGEAFQLTNFLRDVGEDLRRGRVYLPADELAAFGVDRELLEWSVATGGTDRRIRRALAALVARNRAVYRRAEPGIALLRKDSRPCVRTAFTLYRAILDEIVAADYAVLHRRVAVGKVRRFAVSGRAFLARLHP
ncbi:phytoene/squalene synthase family protein [Prauserella oleivorans]|uniref:Phytoene/squalene synthase family protein n=1 Tax=Prauserella oleivorans TaxID=1478153 RepID=A0ABW5WFK1_9PSEU